MQELTTEEQLREEIARLKTHNEHLQTRVAQLEAQQDEAGKRQRQAWMQEVFASGGEVGALMAKIDWSSTPVGPIKRWSQSMCMTLSLCLSSRFPMLLLWGPEYIQFYNDAYIPILGTKHPGALGQDVASCWPETWEKNGTYASIRKSGTLTFYQNARYNLLRHGYLEETYFTGTYSPLRDEAGRINGLLSSTIETTQQVLLERRMRMLGELATRTAQLYITADVCSTVLQVLAEHPEDLPCALLYWLSDDGKLAHLTGCVGLAPGTLLVPKQLVFAHPEASAGRDPLAQAVLNHQAQLLEDLSPLLGETLLSMQEQTVRTASVLPIGQGYEGRPAALLVAGISPYRAFDGPYRDFFQLLATQIGAALTNARSYQEARARAEQLAALDRAKTSFFSNISHEFRTPLTLLLGPLEDLLSGSAAAKALPTPVYEQLSLAHRNALRLLKLVNTLLDFSRIEAGRMQAIYVPTDLAALTRDLASMFRSAAKRAGLQLWVDCPSLSEPVYVDREMWEKIVLNLLSNALKFTFEGEITVSLHQRDDQVELAVRDTGTGIAASELPHLFERFHRVQGARARTHEGSGIGLALVSDLVHLHGGSISVTSTPGRGSTFTVRVPTGSAHLPATQVQSAPSSQRPSRGCTTSLEEVLNWLPATTEGSQTTYTRSFSEHEDDHRGSSPVQAASTPSASILVAEDNADMRNYLVSLLSHAGYTVRAVEHGRAALNALHECLPDLLLTDVMMPELDGLALLREVRATPATQRLPVILLSARAGEEAAIEGLSLGTDDYLMKPFSARELLARVRVNVELGRIRERAVQDAQQYIARLQGLYEVSLMVNSTLAPQAILQLISEQARVLLGAQYAITSFTDQNEWAQTIASVSMEEQQTEASNSMADQWEEQLALLRSRYQTSQPSGAVGWLEAPLFGRSGNEIGAVQLAGKQGRAFTEEDQLLFLQLAQMTSLAIGNARLYETAQDAASIYNQQYIDLSALVLKVIHEAKKSLRVLEHHLERFQKSLQAPKDSSSMNNRQEIFKVTYGRLIMDMEQQMRNAQEVIGSLHDVLQLQQGQLRIGPATSFDLVEVAQQEIAAARQQALAHQVMLLSADRPILLQGDEARIRQVFRHLLKNATTASEAGKLVLVDLTTNTHENEVVVCVQDQGAGFSEEDSEHAFDHWYWAAKKRQQATPGLGLGLSLSQAIVQQHGGRIWLKSTPDLGSHIYFTLPIRPS